MIKRNRKVIDMKGNSKFQQRINEMFHKGQSYGKLHVM
uniref:Uncharacterized protein n=1 Tax=Arundo donax TaxID=35708 RepID=A0A0A9A7X9_ARUDO